QGADRFGWSGRNPQPRSMMDGNELVGWGMSSGIWEAMQMEASAKAVLTANGSLEIASATADIGPGTYTMMAPLAGEMLGVPIENVTARVGVRPAACARARRIVYDLVGRLRHPSRVSCGAERVVTDGAKNAAIAVRRSEAQGCHFRGRQDPAQERRGNL